MRTLDPWSGNLLRPLDHATPLGKKLLNVNRQIHYQSHVYVIMKVVFRKMSFYIVTYYLPSGLFVMVSWISFLVNPDVIPGN